MTADQTWLQLAPLLSTIFVLQSTIFVLQSILLLYMFYNNTSFTQHVQPDASQQPDGA